MRTTEREQLHTMMTTSDMQTKYALYIVYYVVLIFKSKQLF